MTTLIHRSTLAAAAFAAFAGFSTGAGATAVTFSFHAAELGDAAALYQRMAARAESACTADGRRPLWAKKAEQDCADRLLDDFVAAAASPGLSALHEEVSGDRLASIR